MNNNAKAISFWHFLKENTIEIPIIQRDYAQGRMGKENLRKNFLEDLKNALDKNTTMKLDFVYGSAENGILNPLDGQQRLTTLWLLHWYIALRAGALNGDTCMIFQKFTYETRISSREFCRNLCIPGNFDQFDGKDIVGFITRQTWFYSAWKQDPTIQSMLRMLQGTKVNDKKGEDIVDGIEEIFKNTHQDTFKEYWKMLAENEIIVFYHLPLKDFGLSDDLYIKMNARGKQLTSFENFKADLIGYITKQANDIPEESERAEWNILLDAQDGFPIKLDTDWTDLFWKNRSRDNRIDEIFFAFLNRFFWNELFIAKSDNPEKYILDIGKGDESSTQENNNLSYRYLNNSEYPNDYDTTIAYKGLDYYRYYNGRIPLSFFQKLARVLNKYFEYSKNHTLFECPWNVSFEFIPQYVVDKSNNNIEIKNNSNEKIFKVSTINQIQRIVFFSICKYFDSDDNVIDNGYSLKRWMRVVWNLVSGEDHTGRPEIRSTSAMRSAIEFINSLDSQNVYESLCKYDISTLGDSSFDKRCKEEIDKAKQILGGECAMCNGYGKNGEKNWEETIIEAEKYAFFKGAIRFLYTDGEGEINWCDFNTKFANVQKYFDENGVAEDYKREAKLLRSFLSRIDIQDNWFGNNKEFWYTSLLNNDYQAAIHYLLTTSKLEVAQACIEDWIKNNLLLQNVLRQYNSWHILSNWRRYSALTQYSKRMSGTTKEEYIIVLNDMRNKLLSDDKIEILSEIKKVEGTTYLYGWDINFKYNGHFFQWYGAQNDTDADVYLMEDDWIDYKKHPNPVTDKVADEDIFYCFKVTEKMKYDKTEFTAELDRLIRLFENSSSYY